MNSKVSQTVSKTVAMNLGSGSLFQGFPQITVRLGVDRSLQAEQAIGSLPAAPELAESYRIWQFTYRALCSRLIFRLPTKTAADETIPEELENKFENELEDELEIDAAGITQISQQNFEELSQQLRQQMNTWLKSDGFLNLDRRLRAYLDPADEIRIILETTDDLLHYLPWHCWDFLQDYPFAEVALSRPEYKRRESRQRKDRTRVRILAILGDCHGIDVAGEQQSLQSLADAEIVFLVTPSRQEFDRHLWDTNGWDLLFFAGHSQTEGETGRIYINENSTHNSLTIEQLEAALSRAIDNGLKLAIFNSCDGVGLAQALGKLQIPQVIVMREPVPNRVAQTFLQYFLEAFAADLLSLYQAMRQARQRLQGLEDDFPGASWLPIICQNPLVEPLTWLQLGGIAPCPYRGLFAFQEEDARLFFGREQVTQDLATAVHRQSLVALIGASGSGKSSAVFAGLIPHLRHCSGAIDWQIMSCRPGIKPFEALAEALVEPKDGLEAVSNPNVRGQAPVNRQEDHASRLRVLELANNLQRDPHFFYETIAHLYQTKGHPSEAYWAESHRVGAYSPEIYPAKPRSRLLLIVDQFEELYTLCPEPEQQTFLDCLLNAVQSAPAFTLLLTLRADFYGCALSDRRFSNALQGSVYNLGPMSQEELQRTITQPAQQFQVMLEPGLVDHLIQSSLAYAGRLPLLEFALTQLWSKQREGWLTYRAYTEIGGVEEAIANHAEGVYARLSEVDRARVQQILVQLVQPGTGIEMSRRIATRDEVGEANWDLVIYLASTRLVVTNRNEATGEETVEIVHEALLRNWRRLERWIEIDGEFRRWQEDLRVARRRWEHSRQDEEDLLRGKLLTDARYWCANRESELSSKDKEFIDQSFAVQERHSKRRRDQRRIVTSSLIVGLIAALMLAGFAWWGWQNSAINEARAIIASSDTLFASQKEFDALIEAIRSQRNLQQFSGGDSNTQQQSLRVLQQAVFRVVEFNRLRPQQSDLVWSVAFSPVDDWIASASQDKKIRLWSRAGDEVGVLEGHGDRVWDVAFSPDGQQLVSASEDKTLKLWNRDGQEIRTFKGHQDAVWTVAASLDGQTIASGSNDRTVKLWDYSGKVIRTLKGHQGAVWAVAFSPNGQTIASGSDDGTVKLWSREGEAILSLEGHQGRVSGVAFSPDGKILASAGQEGTVILWTPAGKKLHTLSGHGDAVWRVAFSPDGKTIASSSWDQTIKLWDRNGNLLTTLNGHTARVRGIAFSPDGQTIASTSEDKTIRLWKIDNGLLKILNGHQKAVIGISFSPDGQRIASTSDDSTVKLWSLEGTLQNTLSHTSPVLSVAFSPDRKTIATAVSDGQVNLWRTDGTLLKSFVAHHNSTWDVAFSPDGQMLASASGDQTIKLWTLDGQLIRTLKGHRGEVREVLFSPEGQTIASASFDRTIKRWKLDGTLITTFKGHSDGVLSLAFSPNGQTIASASFDRTVKLWKLDGTELRSFQDHTDGVRGVAFNPDGQTIASASGDGTVKLWSLDGTLLNTLRGHSNAVWKVAFSPDGQKLASTGEDKIVILWNREQVQSLKPLQFGCEWVKDYLKTNPDVSDRRLCSNFDQ